MTDLAVRVHRLGKRYRLGDGAPGGAYRYHSLRETLMTGAGGALRRLRGHAPPAPPTELWALRDVSFDVRHGEALGIVGRNGAGKSTLLKILSRITRPSAGRARVYGRVGSLLEVGTGFHPELTGRENIFLSGAIMGMAARDIRRRFDEIVAFAELERFLDTPVKRYSSGMYMRLAFSVAAHLEPEVLVVDEVLAVGDAEFQRKCMGKMGAVAGEGRTVLFVSHNMGALINLCPTSLLLAGGRVQAIGPTREIVHAYLHAGHADASAFTRPRHRYSDQFAFVHAEVRAPGGGRAAQVSSTEGFDLVVDYDVRRPVRGANVTFELWTEAGECVFASTDLDDPEASADAAPLRRPGAYTARVHVPSAFLRAGTYRVDLSASIPSIQVLDIVQDALTLNVVDTGSPMVRLGQGRRGITAPVLTWHTAPRDEPAPLAAGAVVGPAHAPRP